MTCTPQDESFRLLDPLTGWEVDRSSGLTGLADPAGLRLTQRAASSDTVHVADLYRCLYPARVAVDPSGRLFRAVVRDGRARLQVLVLDQRAGRWEELALPDEPASISSLSWGQGLLAVADARARRVQLLRGTPLREVLRVDLAGQVEGRLHLVAVTPWSLLAAVTREPAEVVLVGMDGLVRRRSSLPAVAAAVELGMVCVQGEDGDRPALVLAVRTERGWRRLLRLDPSTLAATVVPASALRCSPPSGFRVEAGDDGTWRVDPSDDPKVQPVRRYAKHGQLRTLALDSGVDDCEWHRIRLDADQPGSTRINLRLATLVSASDRPREQDWQVLQVLPSGAVDALVIGRPRGRFLRLELELFGDGRDTPVVRSIRAGFNVTTGLARLPAVYRADAGISDFTTRFVSLVEASLRERDEAISSAPLLPDPDVLPDHVLLALAASIGNLADPSWSPERLRRLLAEARAAEFTRRFLSLFEASVQELDEAIAFAPLLQDPDVLPDYVLPALAARIGIRADPSWSPDRLRRLLAAWPRISPLLGTPRGLRSLIAVIHGVDVLVEEPGRHRPWGAAGHAHLGQIRLFGLSRASLRLEVGRLGEALLEPNADLLGPAYGSGAYRCTVHVPATLPARERPALEALIRAYLPAHLSVTVRYAFPAVRVGPPLAVSVGTRVSHLEPGVLAHDGDRAMVLGRRGVLGAGRGGGAVTVGRRSVAGIST